MDAPSLQFVWSIAPKIKQPTPSPFKPIPRRAAVHAEGGAGGQSGLESWASIYSWEPTKKLRSECEPDPLEVLRSIPKTEERISRRELRCLRRKVGLLTVEKSAAEIKAKESTEKADAKIKELETRIEGLTESMEQLQERFKDSQQTQWKFAWKPYHGQTIIQTVASPTMPLPVEKKPKKPSPWPQAILRGLPYAGGAAIAALATYWLVDEGQKGAKFVGYGSAVMLLLTGVLKAVETVALENR